ncbi:hypothetical protein AAF712_011667 [Marasmius tenuissimus]|uniref:Mid2 domain-containing protein n=1 Tax=Marasmius tenuissimus TaxID=585030 RepID=A0ABR2ZKP7_9AGAR
MASNLRTKNITYDDRDMTDLKYQGFWFNTGTWNASNVGQSGTLSSSNDPNANVTFNFPVPAVAFRYYGMLRSKGGFYGICIDCDPNQPNFQNIDAVNTTDDGKNPPVVLFSKTFDTPAQHVVILRNQHDTRNPTGNSQITIDRFELDVVDDSPVPVTPSSSSPPSPTSESGKSGPPIGAIVGGAVGGFLLAVIMIGAGLYCWHRKRRKAVNDLDSPGPTPHGAYPLMIRGHSRNDTTTSFSLSTLSPSVSSSLPSTNTSSDYSTGSSSRTRSSRRTGSTQRSSDRRTRRGRRHEVDAGPVIVEDEEDDEALPPQYDSVFRANSTRRTGPTGPGALESDLQNEGAQHPPTSSGPLPPPLVPLRPKK